MKCFRKSILACMMFLLTGNYLNACELPAHPSAAAMPVKNQGLKLIEDGASFYYLIPEGKEIKMKIVWDPYCHNAKSVKKEEYDGVIKENIDIDSDVDKINGYGFFPLKSMSQFFTLRGNRKDLTEAFSRETGISKTDKILSDNGLGPELAFTGMFSSAPDLKFSIVGEKTNGYGDDTIVKATQVNEASSISGINSCLPSAFMHSKIFMDNAEKGSNDVFVIEEGKAKLINKKGDSKEDLFNCYDVSDSDYSKLVVFSNSGIYLGDMKIDLTEPEPEDYKAYLVDDGKANKVEIKGIKWHEIEYDTKNQRYSLKNESEMDSEDAKGPSFDVVFTTPSLVGKYNENKYELDTVKSTIKMMVNSPAAGYELSNLYWVWEETLYERKTSGKYELAVGSNPSNDTEIEEVTENDSVVKKIDASQEGVYVYEKKQTSKSSASLVIIYSKPQDGTGFSAYRIYDNKGPICSELTVTPVDDTQSEVVYFEEDNNKVKIESTFKFELKVVDTNPYFDSEFDYSTHSQNKENMGLTFFYNYPVYSYYVSDKGNIKINDLNGVGLVDFPESNQSGEKDEFVGYTHKVNWYWKAVSGNNVKIEKIEANKISSDDGSYIGCNAKIMGTFTIKNPKPWHEMGDAESKKFAIFALFKDTAGKTHITEISEKGFEVKDEVNSLADPSLPSSFPAYAINPNNNSVVKANVFSENASDIVKQRMDWTPSSEYFQSLKYIGVEDKTAPEIQVIVFDTRTNRYHIFGTSENTAAAFIGSTDKNVYKEKRIYDIDYTVPDKIDSINKIPYINKDSDISKSYKYNVFNCKVYNNESDFEKLFDYYLKGYKDKDKTKAISTIFDIKNKNGFVCQKGTRLIFYAHAFDNIGYQEKGTPGGGLNSFKIQLVDEINGKTEERLNGDPLEYVFRQENYDKNGNKKQDNKSYKLIVTAEDKANPVNKREFELEIAVLGRTLDIRTLEEKRERIE